MSKQPTIIDSTEIALREVPAPLKMRWGKSPRTENRELRTENRELRTEN
jgi:hypothetical protein